MKVAFIILNYNTYDLTKKLALKVSKFKMINKVVIVDNCSPDNSYEELKKIQSERIEVMLSDKNGGYSYGNNLGAKYCAENNFDIICIANPDINIEEKDINKVLLSFAETDYSLLSCIQYEIDGKIGMPAIWKRRTYSRDLIECFYLGRKILKSKKGVEIDYSQKIQQVDLVKGSFFAIRLKDFMEIGGLDENIFLYNEEIILAERLRNSNKKIGVLTDARYDHMHAVSVSKSYKKRAQRMKLLYKSRLYFNETYLKINIVQKIILIVAMKISIFEFYFLDALRSIFFK